MPKVPPINDEAASPDDAAKLERQDRILRLREGIKEKQLSEKAACGWCKDAKLKTLDEATDEQLAAVEKELAART